PVEYAENSLSLRTGTIRDRKEVLIRLVEMQYSRNDMNFARGSFRVRGDTLEIFPASQSERALRVEFFGDQIDRITEIDTLTGEVVGKRAHIIVFPASHFVTSQEKMELAIGKIETELAQRLTYFKAEGKLLEAQRLEQRCKYDLELFREIGFCPGIENYSRHMDGRLPGTPPFTLIDYFPKDYLLVIDESHVTLPQVRGMYAGDKSRKETLVEYGFRLPSAMDNRPLMFDEFNARVNQMIYVSATPTDYEISRSVQVVEQVIRPTGLLDPEIEVRPITGQIDDLYGEIRMRVANNERVLVTTLTKRMAEELTDYYKEMGIKVRYLHSDIDTLERMVILRDLRLGVFDVLVGINLLREGLDLPEVSLVAIIDADKEGFLRSTQSLIQTTGRAARNEKGKVIMYADKMTESMRRAIVETNRRRNLQSNYNIQHNIIPTTINKKVRDLLEATESVGKERDISLSLERIQQLTDRDRRELIGKLEKEMKKAAKEMAFEHAAQLRDLIIELKVK
ncbi:MAG: excinuclease ABC subunit UvrB, partial [bacterium]|nr:excinuclease ABC subunit UvrB [bacterium]